MALKQGDYPHERLGRIRQRLSPIAFELDHPASVSVRVYDELGQRVRVLAAEAERPVGSYQFVWDGLDQDGGCRPPAPTFWWSRSMGCESHRMSLEHWSGGSGASAGHRIR